MSPLGWQLPLVTRPGKANTLGPNAYLAQLELYSPHQILCLQSRNSHFLCETWALSGYDTVHSCYSCYSTLGTGLQNNKREDCGSKTRNSRKVCGKEPAKGEGDWGASERRHQWGQLLFLGNLLYF